VQTQEQIFDQSATLAHVEGDWELLAELVELSISESGNLLDEIRQSIAGADCSGLQRSAHALKGAAGNFGATQVIDLARRLEEMGKTSRLDRASELCSSLEQVTQRLNEALSAMIGNQVETTGEMEGR
jgi:two-component system sensor histidine kinase/response regulator